MVKGLLFNMFGLWALMVFGALMAAQVLEESFLVVLVSAISAIGEMIFIIIVIGLWGMFYQIKIMTKFRVKTKRESSGEAIVSGVSIIIVGLILSLPTFILGSKSAILETASFLIVAGFGLSLVTGMRLLGAIIAHFQMH